MSDGPSQPERSLLAFCRAHGVDLKVGPKLEPNLAGALGESSERYVVVSELGRGAFGRVVLGVDRDLRRGVAIKLLASEQASTEDMQSFLEEAIITGGLEHPNIVPAYELGHSDALGLYFTMKHLPGRSLRDLIDLERDAPSPAFGLFRRLVLFAEVCRAVAYAHDRQVIHTDLKPENVLVGTRGEVLLSDWGEAQVLDAKGLGERESRSGTPMYMSPEQVLERRLDVRSDVWSLGVMLFELLTLESPFSDANQDALFDQILHREVPSPHPDAALAELVESALRKRRENRTGSVEQLLIGVTAYIEGARESQRRQSIARASVASAEAAVQRAEAVEGEDHDARARRFAEYGAALDALRPGLEVKDSSRDVGRLAGAVYWGVFSTVHPARSAASPELASNAIALLAELSELALIEIVSAGRALVPDTVMHHPDRPPEDPWLSVVRAFGEREGSAPDGVNRVARRVALLKGTELFSSLASSDLLPIADACHARSLEDSEVLFNQGDPGAALYVVESGQIDIVLAGDVVNSLGAGEVFGEISVLSEEPRTAGARALGETRVLMLEADRFREVVSLNGEVGLCVIDVLTRRLRLATEREADVRRRLAETQ